MSETQAHDVEEYAEDGFDHAAWSEALRDGVLLGQECDDCGNVTGTPKAACPEHDCGSRELSVVELPDEGTVESETTIGVPPENFERGYQVAIVEVGEGRVLGRVEDTEVEIEDEVELSGYDERDEGTPVPVFEATQG